MTDNEDHEMQEIFLEEARQILDQAEDAFVRLEAGDFSTKLLETIMRLAHNLKGSARAVGFPKLAALAHSLEDALILLQKKKIKPDAFFTSVLLKALDELKIVTNGLSKDYSFTRNTQAIEAELKNLESYIETLKETKQPAPAALEPTLVSQVPTPVTLDTTPATKSATQATAATNEPVGDFADDEMRNAFLDDAKQLLEDAEDSFVSLESGEFSNELLDKIMRLAHNFKGSARVVSFLPLAQLAHHMEDALILLQKKQLKPDTHYSAILMKTLDELKIITNGLCKDFSFTRDTRALENDLASLNEYIEKINNPSNSIQNTQSSQTQPTPSPNIIERPKAIPPSKNDSTETKPQKQNEATNNEHHQEETVRVSANKLDSLLNLMGELVVDQTILSEYFRQQSNRTDSVTRTVDSMKKQINEMRDIALTFRMTPVSPLFRKMRRAVRDVANQLSKDIVFEAAGEDVELDKTVVEQMGDPLTHLIRNAVDHGVENKEDRKKSGKPLTATIRLSAEQRNDQVAIIVSDDGKGLDKDFIRRKALEKGLIRADAKLSDDEIYRLLFLPGFSTKDVATDISGRGVGMDVVQKAIEHLKGKIQIFTQLGKGTSFEVILPLSLSIIHGMIVRLGKNRYTVPLTQLIETLDFRKVQFERTMGDGMVVNLRGEIFPIFSLTQIMENKEAKWDQSLTNCSGIVVSSKGKKVVFAVDEVLHQQQVVIKKLGKKLQALPGIAGGTVLSNGDPSLVLDLYEIIEEIGRDYAA